MDVTIGRVIKSHGIRGEVVVDPTTDDPDERFAVGQVLTGTQTGRTHELTVTGMRPHKNRLLVTFKEISTRDEAESLRGTKFTAPPRDDDEDEGYYDHELEGLTVIHDGEAIGEITSLTHGPGGTLLEVTLTESKKTALIPFVFAIVPEVDLEAGQVTITPPEGLLDL